MGKNTPPASRGPGGNVPGGTQHTVNHRLDVSSATILRRVLDGIEKRCRLHWSDSEILTWTAGVLRNELAAARQREAAHGQ